ASEQHDLFGRIRLDELETSDSVPAIGESGGKCTLNVVEVDEQTIDFDVARAAALDHDRTISLHAADVVGIEKHLFTVPRAEHVLSSILVVQVVGSALAGHEANNSSSAFLGLGNDTKGFVEENKVGATLRSTEGNGRRDLVGRTNEHLGDTSETNFGALEPVS
ncbi:hypothetical protein J3A83DRAFT_4107047, partial [Scleroderma citrinum]